MEKKLKIFCIFLQTKFHAFLILEKQKETTMKTITISQKFLLKLLSLL